MNATRPAARGRRHTNSNTNTVAIHGRARNQRQPLRTWSTHTAAGAIAAPCIANRSRNSDERCKSARRRWAKRSRVVSSRAPTTQALCISSKLLNTGLEPARALQTSYGPRQHQRTARQKRHAKESQNQHAVAVPKHNGQEYRQKPQTEGQEYRCCQHRCQRLDDVQRMFLRLDPQERQTDAQQFRRVVEPSTSGIPQRRLSLVVLGWHRKKTGAGCA
jgi:hypothetical protein